MLSVGTTTVAGCTGELMGNETGEQKYEDASGGHFDTSVIVSHEYRYVPVHTYAHRYGWVSAFVGAYRCHHLSVCSHPDRPVVLFTSVECNDTPSIIDVMTTCRRRTYLLVWRELRSLTALDIEIVYHDAATIFV